MKAIELLLKGTIEIYRKKSINGKLRGIPEIIKLSLSSSSAQKSRDTINSVLIKNRISSCTQP